ncbi:MAG: hypothetical protein K5643_04360 [Saccharofermentans sp.]|nr:hypothetical protein [Saccharofermentans sp.]
MANKNTKRKTTTKKRTTSASSRSHKKANVGFGDYLHHFIHTKAFVPVTAIFAIALIIGLDFLFSLNDYTKFFTILGVELLIALICWIVAMLIIFGRRKSSEG